MRSYPTPDRIWRVWVPRGEDVPVLCGVIVRSWVGRRAVVDPCPATGFKALVPRMDHRDDGWWTTPEGALRAAVRRGEAMMERGRAFVAAGGGTP